VITYKGYTALLEVDAPSGQIVGHVIGIRDEIVFSGETYREAVEGFHKTVDHYLSRLAEDGKEPERPFSGRFNVRIDADTHRALVLAAEAQQISLNDVVKRAFSAYLGQAGVGPQEAAREVGTTPLKTGLNPAVLPVARGHSVFFGLGEEAGATETRTRHSALKKPGGKQFVYRHYITLPTGERLYARQVGKKAFPKQLRSRVAKPGRTGGTETASEPDDAPKP
jgi:predicted HicB family RNase H-like nuclease